MLPAARLSGTKSGGGRCRDVFAVKVFRMAVHEVVGREISFVVLPTLFVCVFATDFSVGCKAPGLVWLNIIKEACSLGADFPPRRIVAHIPQVEHLPVLIEVVDIGIDGKHLPIIEAHQEYLAAPKPLSATVDREFRYPHADVFPFEAHIHHITLIVHVPAGKFRLLTSFVVNLDAAHDIGGQVVERGLYIALKKSLPLISRLSTRLPLTRISPSVISAPGNCRTSLRSDSVCSTLKASAL